MLSSLVINRTAITVGAATLYGFYTITSLAIRRAKRSYYTWKNRSAPLPAIPQEIQHSIITSIIESELYNKSNILQLSLVCKDWDRFVSHHRLWEQNWQYNYYTKSYYDNCLSLSPKIRFFWLQSQEQQDSDLPKILDAAKRRQYEQYLPWMNHNVFKYPEILFKFLKAVITTPEWIYFLVIRRARSSRGFYRNEYNAKRMVYLQRILFAFTTTIPFMAILTPILKTNIWSQLMSSTSIWSALWLGAPNLPVLTQLRLLAILGAFLPFELSLFLTEAYTTRAIPYLVMALANGGILRFVGALASAFAIKKWHNRLEKELIPLPYWKLAFMVTYPLSSLLYLASMLVWELSLNNTMKPTLQSYCNAKYWLLFGAIVAGLMLALPYV